MFFQSARSHGQQKAVLRPLTATAVAAAAIVWLSGCSGGGGHKNTSPTTPAAAAGNQLAASRGTGTVSLTVQWPASKGRIIPAETASIVVEARTGEVLRTGTLTAPATTLVLDNVPAGNTVLRAYAYVNADGTGDLLASGEKSTVIVSDTERRTPAQNENIVLGLVPPPVIDDRYVLGGTAAIDPDTPSLIRMTLNAIVNRDDGTPIEGLTEANFTVQEDGIVRTPLFVSPVSGTSSKADIAFIVDTTGSMSEEIGGVRNSIIAFADSLKDAGVDVRFSGVEFGDEVRTQFAFTSDVDSFKGWVDGLYAEGGDDTPENPLDATLASLGFDWRPDAQHVIIILTDAPAHNADSVTSETFSDVVDKTIGRYVIHTISPGSSRAFAANANGQNGRQSVKAQTPVSRGRASGAMDVKPLSDQTGGTWGLLPYNGNVDLTKLPIKDAILKGYLIKFAAPRSNRDHTLRVVVKDNDTGAYVADQQFKAHY